MPTLSTHATSGGTISIANVGSTDVVNGSKAGVPYVSGIYVAWQQPAAGAPTTAYVSVDVGGTTYKVYAYQTSAAVSTWDGFNVQFPGPGLQVGDKANASLVSVTWNNTSPVSMDLTVVYRMGAYSESGN